jgi:N-acetylneuraminate synthase
MTISKKIFLIAEIGINHNGDINLAKKLILEASNAGFDAVKFQKRTLEKVYTKEFLLSERKSPWGKTQGDQKKGLEFTSKDYDEIDRYCKELNIEWFASAWDLESLTFLDRYNCNYAKVASAMIVDQVFLNELAKRKKYTFISTGMSTLKDITQAVEIFKSNNCEFELMHCFSTYPMEVEDANLETIISLRNKFNCNVGYSGHESGLAVSFAAVGMNITSLERHITLDRASYGSDQAASIEPRGMQLLIKTIKSMQLAHGKDMIGQILDKEIPIAKKLREHIQN